MKRDRFLEELTDLMDKYSEMSKKQIIARIITSLTIGFLIGFFVIGKWL